MVASPPIAAMALMFGPAELAMLILFALVVVAGTGAKSQLKGLISTALGMLLATVGLDPITTQQRFTFGSIDLDRGHRPAGHAHRAAGHVRGAGADGGRLEGRPTPRAAVRSDDPDASRVTWPELKGSLGTIFRSQPAGLLLRGPCPGWAASPPPSMGYDQARRLSKHPERFGKGELNGVAAPEAAQQRGVRRGPDTPW